MAITKTPHYTVFDDVDYIEEVIEKNPKTAVYYKDDNGVIRLSMIYRVPSGKNFVVKSGSNSWYENSRGEFIVSDSDGGKVVFFGDGVHKDHIRKLMYMLLSGLDMKEITAIRTFMND